jgi:hypothetical protein
MRLSHQGGMKAADFRDKHENPNKFQQAGEMRRAFSCRPDFHSRLVCLLGFDWMNLFVRVNTSFYGHIKTIKLRAKLGNDAFWIPPRIWALAAEQRPNGEFEGISPEELAIMLGYVGDASGMLQALLQAGFMDSDPLRIHDWAEYNGYHAVYAERARVAAKARWAKKGPKKRIRDREGDEKRGEETSIASSMLQASNGHFVPPTTAELIAYAKEINASDKFTLPFINFYESKGWMVGKNKMKKWRSAFSGWVSRNSELPSNGALKPDYSKGF